MKQDISVYEGRYFTDQEELLRFAQEFSSAEFSNLCDLERWVKNLAREIEINYRIRVLEGMPPLTNGQMRELVGDLLLIFIGNMTKKVGS